MPLLLLLAVILFVLTSLGVTTDDVHLGWLGLAFFAAAGLVPDGWLRPRG